MEEAALSNAMKLIQKVFNLAELSHLNLNLTSQSLNNYGETNRKASQ